MIEGDASRFMLKIESFVTALASIDCAIRWSNLFSMTLKTEIFAGMIVLQSIATILLIVGVTLTIWELWSNRNAARLIRTADWDEEALEKKYQCYILCEIPVTRKMTVTRVNAEGVEEKNRAYRETKIQVRAKKEIWFTAASAFIDDFLVPCVFFILYENDCEAFKAAGGNNWFDITEAAIGTLAALFVWIIVGSLLLRVATLLRRGECAPKAPACLRWTLCILIGSLGVLAVGFSLIQGGGMGLFLSTECPQNATTAKSTIYHGFQKLTRPKG